MWIVLLLVFLPMSLLLSVHTKDLDDLSANPYSFESTANPFGAGSPFRSDSPANPYSRGLRIEGR